MTVGATEPLFELSELVEPTVAHTATIQERFEAWIAVNGWVVTALETLVADYLAAGRTRLGMKHLVEVVRWEFDRRTTGDPFKINNDYTSRLTRLLIARDPALADVFAVRALVAA